MRRFAAMLVMLGSITFTAASDASLIGGLYADGSNGIGTVSDAVNVVNNASSPTVTFTSTLLSYSSSDGGTSAAFLGADAASATGTLAPLASFVMDLHGFVKVDTTGTYTFTNNNDDGGAWFLNGNGTPGSGTILGENDGDHGNQPPPAGTPTDILLTAGVAYPVEYIYYNQACGGCGFTGNADGSGGGANSNAIISGPGTVDLVQQVPEPATGVLLALGAVGLFVVGRRRK